ncbi:MAG: hypothetical protein P8R32_05180 [Candidatus Poseidoniia archaeon]|nr:hypothetical protein [Candidatus Poseidoniia archaeon]
MKIPDHLRPPLLEQLEDQTASEDCLVLRGSALGHALLGDNDKRNFFIEKFIKSAEPPLEGTQLARELQARGVGNILLEKNAEDYLSRAKELFENELEEALPNLPEDIAIDVATEPLKQARQARSGLMENAFLRKEWKLCISEAEHGRSIIPDYLLYQPHREGYPIEFVAKGMDANDKDLISKGFEMQEEFLQYVIDVGYLKPWEEAYFVSHSLSVITRTLVSEL